MVVVSSIDSQIGATAEGTVGTVRSGPMEMWLHGQGVWEQITNVKWKQRPQKNVPTLNGLITGLLAGKYKKRSHPWREYLITTYFNKDKDWGFGGSEVSVTVIQKKKEKKKKEGRKPENLVKCGDFIVWNWRTKYEGHCYRIENLFQKGSNCHPTFFSLLHQLGQDLLSLSRWQLATNDKCCHLVLTKRLTIMPITTTINVTEL